MKKSTKKLLITTISIILCLAIFSTTNIFAGTENSTEEIIYNGYTYKIQKSNGLIKNTIEVECLETNEKAISEELVFSNKITISENDKTIIVIDKNTPTQQEYTNELKEARKGKYRYIAGHTIDIDSKTIGYREYKHTTKTNSKKWKCKAINNNNSSKYKTFYYKKKPSDWNRFSDAVDDLDLSNKSLAGSVSAATASAGYTLITAPTGIPALVAGLVAIGASGASIGLFLKVRYDVNKCNKTYEALF